MRTGVVRVRTVPSRRGQLEKVARSAVAAGPVLPLAARRQRALKSEQSPNLGRARAAIRPRWGAISLGELFCRPLDLAPGSLSRCSYLELGLRTSLLLSPLSLQPAPTPLALHHG